MSNVIFNKLLILGVGLIGGSLALAAKHAGVVSEVRGWSRRQVTLQRALELGVVDSVEHDLQRALQDVDCVVVATPSQFAAKLLVDVVARVPKQVVITDVASVKGNLAAALRDAYKTMPANVVLGHPIAGSEKSGVEAARASLFDGQRVILTPDPHTAADALQAIESLWRACGASVHEMSTDAHDRVFGMTSHLPHVLAYALVDFLAAQPAHEQIFDYSGAGFRDFTRIAGSDPRMWQEIVQANKEALLIAIEGYENKLAEIKAAMQHDRGDELQTLFDRAKAARDAHST
ncbi:MAG: prephenate dehydrogenase/arogenate dehydrogenase family protein [Pseudomonadales bacterium]|nr:prephenate dehydrogenase/arogenate dehydrogenase family protein [Gammaproteobacteria bacterium]NNL57565.1 prephenate dehydrogenase/arogenate dehydrogenase family protein [Pseudomonadales bacterium]